MKKTKIKHIKTKNGIKTEIIEVELTLDEVALRVEEEQLSIIKSNEGFEKQARIQAYIDAGWANAYDLIDDILENGIEAIKLKRDKIKTIKGK